MGTRTGSADPGGRGGDLFWVVLGVVAMDRDQCGGLDVARSASGDFSWLFTHVEGWFDVACMGPSGHREGVEFKGCSEQTRPGVVRLVVRACVCRFERG